jgi:hypothetical protein
MRIKPWALTSGTAALALSSLAIIVTLTDPAHGGLRMRLFFWLSLAIALWAGFTTFWLWSRMHVAQAVWGGLLWMAAALGAVLAWRAGLRSRRLMEGIVFATLLLSVAVWRLFRHGRS